MKWGKRILCIALAAAIVLEDAPGGTIVTEGTPEQVAQCEQSWTGKFLRDML